MRFRTGRWRLVVLPLILGFPIVLVLSWPFSEFKREGEIDPLMGVRAFF
ncbi:MAG TPA: hypothetical protein VGF73_02410 [Chthoniobacterales bacterium]